MKTRVVAVTVAACLAVSAGATRAEEIQGKFRFSAGFSYQSNSDGLRTNADNTARIENPFGGVTTVDDPRPDSAVKNEMSIKDDWRLDVQASYGLMSWGWGELTLDAGVGYFEGDLRSIEMAAEFALEGQSGVDPPRFTCGELTRFHLLYIPAGSIEEYPVQIGTTLRFRPRAKGGPLRGMNPYLGVGVGYMFVSLNPSEEFMELSRNMANSTGYGLKRNGESGRSHQFKAAAIDAPDTFEYHLKGGVDFPIKKGLTIYLDAGWMWANEAIDITFDGKHEFGRATVNGETKQEWPDTGLGVQITEGGLVDYASGTPTPVEGRSCEFRTGPKDGIVDFGRYYLQGGELRYDGLTVGMGVRYSF